MTTVARDAVPTCMRTVVPLGAAGLSMAGLSMWPATMIGRLGLRAAPTCGVARVVVVALRTMGALVESRRTRWAVVIGRVEVQAWRVTVALLCAMIGRVALRAVATPLPVVATDRAVATFTVVAPPAASPVHIWPDGTTVRRALVAVVSRAAVARAVVVSRTPLLAATMTDRLEPAARRSAVVSVAGTLSNLT